MTTAALLAVPNISEGRDEALVRRIAGTDALLDVSSDPDHNRSVLTYGGEPERVMDACLAMIDRAVASLDLRDHTGVHPRFGVVDVLPFVPYGVDVANAEASATEMVWRIGMGPGVPTFLYGTDRTLPELRRELRTNTQVHPTAGVICVGVREPLLAFNVNLRDSLDEAKLIARTVRSDQIRALAFELTSRRLVQVSMNLIDPLNVGPREVYRRVGALARDIVDCEVVGLVPDSVPTDGLPWRRPVRSIDEALT